MNDRPMESRAAELAHLLASDETGAVAPVANAAERKIGGILTNLVINVPGEYISLGLVLQSALEQASKGKGKERHASEGEAYSDQIICEVTRRVGLGYPLGQAVKKIYESQRIGGERGVAELLGALNYVAAAVIVMREGLEPAPKTDEEPKFKPGDRVQYRVELPSVSDWIWRDATYLRPAFSWQQDGEHIVTDEELGPVTVKDKDIRPAPKAEGVEELVQKDAPQTPQELYQHIVDCNPATFHTPSYAEEQLEHRSRLQAHKPTGEELAEMTEEETHG